MICSFSENSISKYELHILRKIREEFNLVDIPFSLKGDVIFNSVKEVRKLTYLLNKKLDDNKKIKSSELNSAGLIHEIFHFVIRKYEEDINKNAFRRGLDFIKSNISQVKANWIFTEFVELFPNSDVFNNKISIKEYLESETGKKNNKEIILEEIILLHLSNLNPAFSNLKFLFDEKEFTNKGLYKSVLENSTLFFKKEKPIGNKNLDLISFLKEPIEKYPYDIDAQLNYIKENWKDYLNEDVLGKILLGKDLIKEEYEAPNFGGGDAPTIVPGFGKQGFDQFGITLGKSGYNYTLDEGDFYEETENFTEDIHWMPNVILIAKNTYVWLDQLSKKYGRKISRLDEIPDQELDMLKNWNFNGLWLIGIWERSSASKKIKHLMGNNDAVSSAYSLYDYEIAHDLGGEEAYKVLDKKAKERGIRLASDMVPNHTGIYSKWVVEHPEYFIQRDDLPFPGYTFNGPDLSDDPRIQIRIEDGYFNHSDAAVVFQRIDNSTGEVKYIYHGNDGTVMPWNDTAQLNMLKDEVREAVIQKIFEVARRFSIIRFDAAMTLAKKHFQRLWYPQPGKGGDIPSRTEYSMTRKQFDEFFPKEFWREVVDRINREMPETLLLAEAFWLMEGYFVRTLGMHRVYNSAFMHMMMKEENEKYKMLIKNTLEFDPEILKRYVNFMSNPDEETAIKQFGNDDKYFGVATLMVTLPGLPMFAHGQIEGFTEKYGMEYKRAYYNEEPDQWLVNRHEREIFSLMKKRYIFSEVRNFWLFDFIDEYGNVNNNVFAFTNYHGKEKALVFYNNKYDRANGFIKYATGKLVNNGEGKTFRSFDLVNALNLKVENNLFYIFKEHTTGLEFIRESKYFAELGFELSLDGFKYNIFMNFREVYDTSGEYRQVYDEIGFRGVRSIEDIRRKRTLKEIHEAFDKLFAEDDINIFIEDFILDSNVYNEKFLINRYTYLLNTIKKKFNLNKNIGELVLRFKHKISKVKELNSILREELNPKKEPRLIGIEESITISEDSNYKVTSVVFLLWLTISSIEDLFESSTETDEHFLDDLLLGETVYNILIRLGRGADDARREFMLLKALLREKPVMLDYKKLSQSDKPEFFTDEMRKLFVENLEMDSIKELLNVNTYKGITYFSKENLEEFVDWIFTLTILNTLSNEMQLKLLGLTETEFIKELYAVNRKLKDLASSSHYKYYDLIYLIENN